MKDFFMFIIFTLYPYICFTTFIVGSWYRYTKLPYTVKSFSSQALSKKSLLLGSTLFHTGVIFVLIGHFVGLLTPECVYNYLGLATSVKQSIAIASGGLFGFIAFIGLTILMLRRLLNPRIRKNSACSDILIVVLIWLQLVLGLGTIPLSLNHPDGSMMVHLATWVQHIAILQPEPANYLDSVPLIYLAHITLGLTLFLVFPFTRLIHIMVAPLHYIIRPGYQIVRKNRP